MKSNEVNNSLIGRRVKTMSLGVMVTGTITKIEKNDYSVCVFYELDAPQDWGGETYRNSYNWARKADEFGSLHHMELI